MKGLDKRIEEGVLWRFGHVERKGRDRIAKSVYVRVCAGSKSVGKPWKRRLGDLSKIDWRKGVGRGAFQWRV